jgi:hypothetical protein
VRASVRPTGAPASTGAAKPRRTPPTRAWQGRCEGFEKLWSERCSGGTLIKETGEEFLTFEWLRISLEDPRRVRDEESELEMIGALLALDD